MHRTQLLIEEWQYEALRARAGQEGRSLSNLVREILSTSLAPTTSSPQSRLREIEGIGEDAERYAEDHDRILYGGRRNN